MKIKVLEEVYETCHQNTNDDNVRHLTGNSLISLLFYLFLSHQTDPGLALITTPRCKNSLLGIGTEVRGHWGCILSLSAHMMTKQP